MDAKELRIGNYVLFNDNTEVKINDIGNAWHTHLPIKDDGFNWVSPKTRVKKYRPIPLTEEWLRKFGFESYYKNGSEYQNKNMYLVKNGDIWQNLKIGVNLKYVHQLQNLYFALTGEELEIK
jgi:hypothetical protein